MTAGIQTLATTVTSALHLGATVLFVLFSMVGLRGEQALMIAALFWLAYLPSYALLLLACVPALLQRRPPDFRVKLGLATPIVVGLLVGVSMLSSRAGH